ncbi:biotin transporter BioY [Nocardioides sp. Iso805N]|uniref:biotin transporter BioY n=1 Tax=Nocardioides sp. Iso805N TaxID=1283287 RepID=UPI00036AC81B|nr:biotin transporter BioY [Nocardioides sp. Iso805N]
MNAATAEPSTDVTAHRPRRLSTTDLALVASFTALIAVCSYAAAIPVGGAGVPITLQTFAVLLTGLVLGPWRALLAVGLYFLIGLAGLPVFAEHSSGASAFTGASAGYLYSFALAAVVAGALAQYVLPRQRTRAVFLFIAALVATVVNHLGGIVGLRIVLDLSWHKAASIDAAYWVGDIVKAAVAAIVAAEVHRAFPALLARRG